MKKRTFLMATILSFFCIGIAVWIVADSARAEQSEWYEWEEGLQGENNDAQGIVIAVIDTGADVTHEALQNRLWINEKEVQGQEGVDDDGNGYVDDIYGYNVRGDNGDVSDTDGHGTHVAGILGMEGAKARSFGCGADIMIVKAGNSQNGFSSENCVKAIKYAVKNGADVITMSLGASYCSEELEQAIQEAAKKAVIVAAAGNESAATSESGYSDASNVFPAGLENVLGVMAYDSDRDLAWFSNWDYKQNTEVDYEIAAPGVDIYSTKPGNSYTRMSGTSMSAPIAAGACAVLVKKWETQGNYSPAMMIGQLVYTADQYIIKKDQEEIEHYFPRINIERALSITPQPRIYVRNLSIEDDDTWGNGNNEDGIAQKGETLALSMELANQWAAAGNIQVEITSDNPEVHILQGTCKREVLGSRDRTQINGEDGILIQLDGQMEAGQQISMDITVRYQNQYIQEKTEYLTNAKLHFTVGEKGLSYVEEPFTQMPLSTAQPDVTITSAPTATLQPSATPTREAVTTSTPKVTSTVAPSPLETATPVPTAGDTVTQTQAPVEPEKTVEPQQTVEATGMPAATSEAKQTNDKNNKNKKRTYITSITKNKKNNTLKIRTCPKGKVTVKIYPSKYTFRQAKKKKCIVTYRGTADKKGVCIIRVKAWKRVRKVRVSVKKKGMDGIWRVKKC